MSIPIDDERHELRLGNSFDPNSRVGFHSIRYDFKPASVDTSKEACVEVGAGNQVSVTVPHIEGAGVPHTVFKGNKQPVMKECVLIIDHDKGTYTLEKLSSKVTLKKTRSEGSSKAMQHISGRVTPVDRKARPSTPTKAKKPVKSSPGHEPPPAPVPSEPPKVSGTQETAAVAEMSDSSSSSSSSSDDDDDEMEDVMPAPVSSAPKGPTVSKPSAPAPPVNSFGVLDNDLLLSESGSDSDDD